MAPFNLKKAFESTQRRKGAKTQGFRFPGSFNRQVIDSSTSFLSRLSTLRVLAITRSADSLACRLAGRDKSPPGYWKQFARHGQASYRLSRTLLSKLLTTRPSLVDSAAKMTAAFASCINPSSFFLPRAFRSHGTRHGPSLGRSCWNQSTV